MYTPLQFIDTAQIHPGITYNECMPSAPLVRFVACYWTLHSTGEVSNAPHRVVPDGCADIIFNFQEKASFLSGVSRETEYFTLNGVVSYLGIRFLPHAVPFILNYTGADAAAVYTEMNSGFKALWNMTDSVLNEGSTDRSLPRIERYLTSFFRDYTISGRFDVLLNHALETGGNVTVRELADYHAVSEKQIGRCFRNNIGISTKSFLRIIRFQTTLRSFQLRKHSTVYQALDSGYYDQSHLIRDMNRFLGGIRNIY